MQRWDHTGPHERGLYRFPEAPSTATKRRLPRLLPAAPNMLVAPENSTASRSPNGRRPSARPVEGDALHPQSLRTNSSQLLLVDRQVIRRESEVTSAPCWGQRCPTVPLGCDSAIWFKQRLTD